MIQLYHHHDGYPEGVGRDLKKYLAEKHPVDWDVCEIANGLVKGDLKYESQDFHGRPVIKTDDEYEITTCIHGDEDYVYIIDCGEGSLKCYRHKWDAPLAETVRPERECEIPEPKKEEGKV